MSTEPLPASETPSSQPAAATPLMRQYQAIKQQNPSAVLLYRMGDFYEMFNEDAQIASRILGLTLTTRNNGAAEATPLAGFPHHAIDRYANKLVKAGYKIAICEQVEDPKTAKGVVKRDIIEIISAGTATEDKFIDDKTNNYIVSIIVDQTRAGMALCDLSTGEFCTEEIDAGKIDEELARTDPSEFLIADTPDNPSLAAVNRLPKKIVTSKFDGYKFEQDIAQGALKDHFELFSLQAMGLEGYTLGIRAAGALLLYLKEQKKSDLKHISSIKPRRISEFAELDPATIRNLELLKPLHTDESGATLAWVLDRTCTSMGARLLKRWITHPLRDLAAIGARLDSVEWLKRDLFVRGEAELILKRIADIERLIGRVMFERANGRDLAALRNSLDTFPRLIKMLEKTPSSLIAGVRDALRGFDDLSALIVRTLVDSPPLTLKEGGLIKPGISAELDELKDASINGKKRIAALQETERQRTGISSLKIGYNRVFGYYIELSKSNMDAAPADYIRKQTLTTGERYITPQLKEMEEKILNAEERLNELEYELFVGLRKQVATCCTAIQKAAEAIAMLDVFIALASAASQYGYCRPVLSGGCDLVVKDGRHPVIERMSAEERFVPNDTTLKAGESQVLLITGPNMAGKSTYLRQNALIAIMAQMGSFVPAAAAEIGIVDKFFTRVGASDRLAQGQSTFLVEMIEVANILNNATDRSLVLLDEVGRGTSTFDGISIAWAVAEYLHESDGRRPRTFFATHYHELTELPLIFPRIKNLHIKVKEWNDKIIFLRKIDEGSCDHSYGIQVARLAGVPKAVIIRAREILTNLEKMELTPDQEPVLAQHGKRKRRADVVQTDLFMLAQPPDPREKAAQDIAATIDKADINHLTPMEALELLAGFKRKMTDAGTDIQ
jgi:DNA mismatch repair protein MutS